MGYFISNQHTNKAFDPNINVIDEIYNIKGRSTIHSLVANYTNKHVTFNKGQCIGLIEPSMDHMLQTSINSLTTQKIIDEHIQPDTFTPPLYTLSGVVRKSLNQLLETFKLQFEQDETSIDTSHKNTNWHRWLRTCLAEAIPHCHGELWLGKEWNKQTPWCASNSQQPFQLVSSYHCSTKGQWKKMPSLWLQGSEQSHMEISVAHAKGWKTSLQS